MQFFEGKRETAGGKELDGHSLSDLKFLLGKEVVLEIWPEPAVETALDQFYPDDPHDPGSTQDGFRVIEAAFETTPNKQVENEADELSIVNKVNAIITQAIQERASDIHIESYENELRVRLRIDGNLQNRHQLEPALRNTIISRIKIMADLDIAERRRPQDGRIRVTNDKKNIDIRVSTLPTEHGEKIVLRILDKSALELDLGVLGFGERELVVYKSAISAPYGMILVTGPTGSGKTTTLYSTLNHLNKEHVNIVTIEDPIEYALSGINQAHARPDIGFGFADALKTFLRQDPDIIMVGEIRDFETAEIAVRAALTGHLVFSTLHTNDAAGAITRLIDMGVEPFLLTSCLRLVVAQRLVRKICTFCRHETTLPKSMLQESQSCETRGLHRCFRGRGCHKCHNTGYSGRTSLFEMMAIDATVAGMVTKRNAASDLKAQAVAAGMKTLWLNGVEKIQSGITTVDEVVRETRS